MAGPGPLVVDWLGRVPYSEALELQQKALEARRRRAGPDRLLLLEHPPVVTLGRRARPEHLLLSRQELADRGIECFEVARGGDVTYHGPGQLVGYLVIDLTRRKVDVHAHVRGIEAALGVALASLGIRTRVIEGMTGVFVDDAASRTPRKIASIGVGVRHWITWHGFALNVDLDLAAFEAIVPCGLRQVEMTSLARELGSEAPSDLPERAREAVSRAFAAL